jgi:hypothetical protein
LASTAAEQFLIFAWAGAAWDVLFIGQFGTSLIQGARYAFAIMHARAMQAWAGPPGGIGRGKLKCHEKPVQRRNYVTGRQPVGRDEDLPKHQVGGAEQDSAGAK